MDNGTERGAAFLDRLAEETRSHNTGEKTHRYKLLTPAELRATPPMRWIVRDVVPDNSVIAEYGPPACSKSFLVLDMLGAISEGRDWFGHQTKSVPCVYVGLEGEAGISQRVKAYEEKNGTLENVRFMTTPLDIRKPGDRREFVAAIKAGGYAGGVLAIDTLNRAAPGMDENDSRSMGEVITSMKALQTELGGVVLVIHHTGKDATRGLRGHSSLLAALDVVIEVTRQENRREWRIAKAKDGEDGKAHPFRLDVVDLGEDAEGYPVTSCVIAPENDAGETIQRVKMPVGGNQRVVWDALAALFISAGDIAPKDAPDELPHGRPCLRLEEAIDKTRDRIVCDPKRKTERVRQAITGLVNRGLLTLRGGFIWIA